RQIAAGTAEDALAVLAVQRARERPLGGFLAQDGELVPAQELAPLLLGMRHLECLVGACGDAREAEDRHRSRRPQEAAPSRVHLRISRLVSSSCLRPGPEVLT